MKQAIIYGLCAAAAVFFVGWSTGMGGALGPNLGFSALMGVFAGALFLLVKRYAGRSR